jgi:hypothetical protein
MLPRCAMIGRTSTARLAILRQRSQLLSPIASTLVPAKRYSHEGPSTTSTSTKGTGNNKELWDKQRVNGFVGHSFPDFLESWNRDTFRSLGYGMAGITGLVGLGGAAAMDFTFALPATIVLGTLTAGYWTVGLADISQTSHVRIVIPRARLLSFLRSHAYKIHPSLHSNTGDSAQLPSIG